MNGNLARLKSCISKIGFMIAGVVVFAAAPAYATLGGSVDTIQTDVHALHALVIATQPHALYSVHEITYGATKVREYANTNGIVFAIAWNGLTHPDLSKLLGTYYAGYKAKIQSRPPQIKGELLRTLRVGTLVVQMGGHMRDVVGRAYDSSLIPSGVSLSDIK